MTFRDLATLQLGIYGAVPVQWDHYQDGATDNDVVLGIKRLDGVDVVVLRGSATLRDWMRDFNAFASPVAHDRLGPVHPGFLLGMEQAAQFVQANAAGPFIVVGHSLGAARSAIMTALLLDAGAKVLARVCWGEPKPGFQPLAALVGKVLNFSYRNGNDQHHDLVTDVPLTFPPEEYCHAAPLIQVCTEPPANDPWGPLRYHHMELYSAAMPDHPVLNPEEMPSAH